jgi:hypothetical protein
MIRQLGNHSLTLRRRRKPLVGLLVGLGLLAWLVVPGEPPLSDAERRLVGEWGFPQVDSPADLGIWARPLANPWQVHEFAPDRTYRFWYVSADDPGQRHKVLEGRWSIANGMLRLQDMPRGTRRFLRNTRIWLSDQTYYLPRTELAHHGLPMDQPYCLDGDELVIAYRVKTLPIARRLPEALKHPRGPDAWKVRRDDAFPGWTGIVPGSR